MICRGVDPQGSLIMDSNVRLLVGETFVGKDTNGIEHVLEVEKVEFFDHRWYWSHRHICKVIDERYEGLFDFGGDDA